MDIQIIQNLYAKMKDKHEAARNHFGRPLTFAEKILASHMQTVCDENGEQLKRQNSYADFFPDRVAMQDATAQMALLQFINAGRKTSAVPASVHCDHLIQARVGAAPDLEKAISDNQEVYDFLRTACQKYGIGFWKPGSGIIHQVVLENYAFPGGMVIGTDSHTPNAGGLGMVAIGVGGADAADVMSGLAFNLKWPGVIGVHLTGQLNGWASPKDVILKLMGILTVKGGTGSIVEFFGEGCGSISATGKGTIANMGAEHGATTSVFPYDNAMAEYLRATGREDWAKLADKHAEYLRADPEVYQTPERFYDRVIHIDLSTLEPHIVGPHTPDLSRPISAMKDAVQKEGYPNPTNALIGSCTNSSYEDIGRSTSIAEFAVKHGLNAKIPFYITPGSETVHATIKRDGLMDTLAQMGGTVLANACGPCIGQWQRSDVKKGEVNSIISSYNRNFPGRNDGNAATLSFLASPEVVTAIAITGDLSFNPLTDTVTTPSGEKLMLPTPHASALPAAGMQLDRAGYVAPSEDGSAVVLAVSPTSERLALLERFPSWNGQDFKDMPVLLKAKGKCTTDHISPAGPWLKYRGHLDKIANNTYSGAINTFTSEAGEGVDVTSNLDKKPLPELARAYKQKGLDWMVVGDENFGEGSSREHAAMQPRHLGCKVIIAKSFARIHESNLKKHGVLPLTFQNSKDYEEIEASDRIDVVGLSNLTSGKPVTVVIKHQNKTQKEIACNHTLSPEQVEWFKAGSALNYLALKNQNVA